MKTLPKAPIRNNWTAKEVEALFKLPFNDLLFQAQQVHRQYFDANTVQVSQLLSIKTGKCPEDCSYCPQSNRYDTGLKYEDLMEIQEVMDKARAAKEQGSTRFCMGAAWRSPKDRDIAKLTAMISGVKGLGMETCMTLGMLSDTQAESLANAGLDYYNHNLDTSAEYYSEIITTRTYQDRLDTLQRVRNVGMKVCSGGIVGLGESLHDRAGLLIQLANLPVQPESVPINLLVKVEGTPLDHQAEVDPFDFIRMIAVARIMMPASHVRLSAGREQMNEQTQALAFLAGANSIFYGEQLLTTANPETEKDQQLFARLGIQAEPYEAAQLRASEHAALRQQASSNQALFYNAAAK